jgi:hypothetical protein
MAKPPISVVGEEGRKSMNNRDRDGERGRLSSKKKRRRRLLVNPSTLKVILAIGPWLAKIVKLAIELVKLFKG